MTLEELIQNLIRVKEKYPEAADLDVRDSLGTDILSIHVQHDKNTLGGITDADSYVELGGRRESD